MTGGSVMNDLTRWLSGIRRLPRSRWIRFGKDLAGDIVATILSLTTAIGMAYGFDVAPTQWQGMIPVGIVAIGITAVLHYLFRVYSVNPRYFGLHDFLNIALTSGVVSVIVLAIMRYQATVQPFAKSFEVAVLYGLVQTCLASSLRIVNRRRAWHTRLGGIDSDNRLRRTIIVGAGDSGEGLIREIQRSKSPGFVVLGLVDDLDDRREQQIHGKKVLGKVADLPILVEQYHVEEIVIAMPEATGKDLRRIIDICTPTGARVRTLPSALSIVSGTQQISSYLRDVDIEDLLKREPIETDLKSISQYLSGERVMITGGGGSIGSELARQIASLSPASLILVGKGENSLYEIEQELLQTNRFRPKTIVADVRDYASMERVFKEYAPTVVFHAAAHKHVPLMESNPIEAIQNNVLGTWQAADLCIRYGVKKMVLISSDKAVRPSSIMGATKRVGEMILGGLALRSETEFAIVRFGNVMGSRGSLIPLLKSQLKRGGPLTITHPDMTRYFMTIPESVQLIIQAGAMGGRSEIFILDMGEPVRIVDLARDLIRLHGLVPDEDIEIIFTGVRPGEKMHEELAGDTEELASSDHPKIHVVAHGNPVDWVNLKAKLHHLLFLCESGKAQEAHTYLMELALGKSGEPFEHPDRWPDHTGIPAEFSPVTSPLLTSESESERK